VDYHDGDPGDPPKKVLDGTAVDGRNPAPVDR